MLGRGFVAREAVPAVPIVHGPLLGIGQHFVSLGDSFETHFCLLFGVRIFVRMPFEGQTTVRFLDFLIIRRLGNAQNLIVSHGCVIR